jgi:hypothetical protein
MPIITLLNFRRATLLLRISSIFAAMLPKPLRSLLNDTALPGVRIGLGSLRESREIHPSEISMQTSKADLSRFLAGFDPSKVGEPRPTHGLSHVHADHERRRGNFL